MKEGGEQPTPVYLNLMLRAPSTPEMPEQMVTSFLFELMKHDFSYIGTDPKPIELQQQTLRQKILALRYVADTLETYQLNITTI